MTQERREIIEYMIATLTGRISEKLNELIVLDVHGVGYGLIVTNNDFGNFSIGEQSKLYVYEHLRENVHELYGFASLEAKKLFEKLLEVKNIGPKVALAILNIGSSTEIRVNIANGNVKYLQSAKGIGRRAAEQIVVELRDKVGLTSSEDAEDIVYRAGVHMKDEATEALISLGYSPQDAAIALDKIDKSLPPEERIRLALKGVA